MLFFSLNKQLLLSFSPTNSYFFAHSVSVSKTIVDFKIIRNKLCFKKQTNFVKKKNFSFQIYNISFIEKVKSN